MGKLAERPGPSLSPQEQQRLARLQGERRKLASRLQQIDSELAKLALPPHREHPPTVQQLDQWFAELSDGLPELPPLPADFSRADLYDDHD